MYSPSEGSEQRLNALFREYRDVCPVPEPSANFMPELWQKIDARRNFNYTLRRWAGGFVTAALAFSLAIGIYSLVPHHSGTAAFYAQNYVEALASAHDLDLDSTADVGDVTQVY
jgi:hypothetical protein